MKKNKGFTLIELVVVIVILGILSVVAAPKFLDISTDAKIAAVNGLSGAISSAARLAQSKCIIAKTCNSNSQHNAASGNIVTMDGIDYTYHYGNITAWGVNGTDITDFLSLSGFTVQPYVSGSFIRIFSFDQGATPINCSVSYQLAFGDSGWSATPDTTGC